MSIATEISRIQTAKTDIKASIAGKGVTVPDAALIDTYSSYVDQISGGGGPEPALGFVATEWNEDGYITKGKWFGGGTIPAVCFAGVSSSQGAYFYLETVEGLNAVTAVEDRAFQYCANFLRNDWAQLVDIASYAFRNCDFTAFILRSSSIAVLRNTNAFANTPIASGTGYIYVPAALVNGYKTATNWITYASQIRAIEDYPEITGGL